MSIQRSFLLLAFAGTAVCAAPHGAAFVPVADAPPQKASAGANAIASVQVAQAADGAWTVTVEYQYSGVPEGAKLVVKQMVNQGGSGAGLVPYRVGEVELAVGKHRAQLPLRHPGDPLERFTQEIRVEIWDRQSRQVVQSALAHKIEWPDPRVVRQDAEVAAQKPEVLLLRAARLIDTGEPSALRQAKQLLERTLRQHPRLDQAYLELARVAMKTNWGPEGLREAEGLIRSAQQLNPASVNARILMGYVLANQGRKKEAASLFEEAARLGTDNLWLWANWGELLLAQGDTAGAAAKFREGLRRPPTGDGNDLARQQAYLHLLQLHQRRGELDAVEKLQRQRRAEYPNVGCFALSHARFLVTMRGDARGAEAILASLPPTICEAGEGRMLLALVHYAAWAQAAPAAKPEALRRARVTAPVSPFLFYALAESEPTAAAAKQLVAAGESIGMQDDQGRDALSYALAEGNIPAAGRLLALGARGDALVGTERMPVALLPVLSGDAAGVQLMQRAGVDYRQLRFRGATAVEIARERGNEPVLRLLTGSAARL